MKLPGKKGLARYLSTLAAATALSMQPSAKASQDFKVASSKQTPIVQQVNSPSQAQETSVSEGLEILDKIQKEEIVEYQGLQFDTPKLRSAQRQGKLSGFDFAVRDNKLEFLLKDPKNPDNKFIISANPKYLSELVSLAFSKGPVASAEEKTKSPNPHDWQYQSDLPQFLTETPDNQRRPMTKEEMEEAWKQAVDVGFKLDKKGVINLKKIVENVADRLDNTSGMALMSAYTITPKFVLRAAAKRYSSQIASQMQGITSLDEQNRKTFNEEKATAIKEYDHRKQIEREELPKKVIEKQIKDQTEKLGSNSLKSVLGKSEVDVSNKNNTYAQLVINKKNTNGL